jgi:hypothetical protein
MSGAQLESTKLAQEKLISVSSVASVVTMSRQRP